MHGIIAWFARNGVAANLLMVAILADYYISRFIRGPIIRLKEVAEEIGAGNLDARVEIDSPDEVGILATAFNQMADQISHATDTLEDRVRERTREFGRGP